MVQLLQCSRKSLARDSRVSQEKERWLGPWAAIIGYPKGVVGLNTIGADTIPHPQVVLGEGAGSDDPTTRLEYDWDGPSRIQIKIRLH